MRERGGGFSIPSGPAKHESADVLARLVAFVNLDAHQVRLGTEPVQPTNPTLPAASHARAALFVRLSDAALRARTLAERVPLLRRHARHERLVHGVENVEVRERHRSLGLALFAARTDEEGWRGADWPDFDVPRQLWRAQDEARAGWNRRLRRGLGQGDCRHWCVDRSIYDRPRGWGKGDIVRDGGVVTLCERDQWVHVETGGAGLRPRG